MLRNKNKKVFQFFVENFILKIIKKETKKIDQVSNVDKYIYNKC